MFRFEVKHGKTRKFAASTDFYVARSEEEALRLHRTRRGDTVVFPPVIRHQQPSSQQKKDKPCS
jgi:hypothetical protein